ncbi:TPR repeat-containing protein P27G11.02 [Grifola frondosa]|uniref:TPR repeat-containing protein P27G11.02 n=1 Tax=Grifola frondosa TaxID=5627 RepID=A0A1C7LXC3_GRIFR|nr:TPR repeat-containing protein P27G11.02 [Grifola frondosa]
MALGVGSTAYGLYQFYSIFTMWPEEVRGDLRAGIKAKHQNDLNLSERYLRRAWETAQTLPLVRFSAEPHLKLSGIAIALAEVLEANDRPQPAYEVYSGALSQLQNVQGLSGRERMRAVSIAAKLGEMAEVYQQPPEEEERWLTWAVEEVLHIVREGQPRETVNVEGASADTPMMLAELDLPVWVSKSDVGAPLEALGKFYAREGKPEYATALYLQATSLLIPPPASKRQASTEELCRGAQLMNNLSDLMLQGPPPDNQRNAEKWARQSLSIIEKAKASAKGNVDGIDICEHTLAAVLFNLGSLLEMAGDYKQSAGLYKASLDQSNRIGMREGTMQARFALRRIERAVNKQSAATSSSTTEAA